MTAEPPRPAPVPEDWLPQFEWLAELLSDSRAVVSTLLWEPLFRPSELRAQIDRYRAEIENAGPLADHALGLQLADNAKALLDAVRDRCDLDQRLAQIAVRYFVLGDDGDDDLMSPFGFDDDVEVFNAVVERIGLRELLISA